VRKRAEWFRKLIHLSSAVVPIAAWLLPRPLTLFLLGLALTIAIAVEVARHEFRWARLHFLRSSRPLLRPHERRRLSGATYMAIGYFLVFLIFPLTVAIAAMLYNAVGDAVAALVGRGWGRHRTSWGKSWEGFGAGFVANLAVGLLVPGLGFAGALIGAVAASILEFLPLPVDDNLVITLGSGLVLWLGMAAGVLA